MSSSPRQGALFDRGLLPWDSRPEQERKAEFDKERTALLAAVADSYLGTIEQRVAQILQRFPETRDSDTALAVRYWKTFQADVLERRRDLDLEVLFDLDWIETITRARRHIQNQLGLFRGLPRTQEFREARQREFSRYLAEKARDYPEIRFYLDETGNEPQQRYTGVAGICVLAWRQYEKYHAALAQWRQGQNWPETLRFADIRGDDIAKHVSLLAELQRRRGGLLFVGHTILSRGRAHPFLLSLFVQLIIDSLRRAADLGSLDAPKAVRVFKESEEGFDAMYCPEFEKQLSKQMAWEFGARVYLKEVRPIPKGREVMLECADLIAGGMQRRALYGGRNPKDRLAEAVMNVTGFEDPREEGLVFNAW